MTKRFFPLCSRQLIKWRCLTALYSLPLWPFLSGTPGVHCSDDNVAMSTSCRYINQVFESRKLEYLTRIERPLLMCARKHSRNSYNSTQINTINELIRSANSVILFSFYRIYALICRTRADNYSRSSYALRENLRWKNSRNF